MNRSDRMTTPSRRRSPDFDVAATLIGLVDRVARLETTAHHGTEMVRWALKRTDQAHGRIDLTDARQDRQAAELSAMNGALRARETAAQHRQEMRRDALKGMGLLLTAVTLIGVLIGKLPADALKWVTSAGVSVK